MSISSWVTVLKGWSLMSFDLDQYVEEHRENWLSFVRLGAYGAGGVILILVLLAIFVV
tara:strand:- start:30 stop:203 length:174 start_codon:yes stop_codon:yes gene_type:complete